jgi:putative acetyltransferase
MIIRLELPQDRSSVAAVHRAAFGGEHGDVVAALVEDLRPGALSLVAVAGTGAVVGHVMFSHCYLDAPARLVDVLTLSPLGVLPAHQRQGAGSALVREGLRLLDQRDVPLVFLEGDPAYYGRLGFRAGHELGFRKPSLRIPDAAFQVVPLAAYEPWMTGTFVYAETFWRHDCVGLR